MEKWVGEGVRELVGFLKASNKSKARSLCEIGLIQTVLRCSPTTFYPYANGLTMGLSSSGAYLLGQL